MEKLRGLALLEDMCHCGVEVGFEISKANTRFTVSYTLPHASDSDVNSQLLTLWELCLPSPSCSPYDSQRLTLETVSKIPVSHFFLYVDLRMVFLSSNRTVAIRTNRIVQLLTVFP